MGSLVPYAHTTHTQTDHFNRCLLSLLPSGLLPRALLYKYRCCKMRIIWLYNEAVTYWLPGMNSNETTWCSSHSTLNRQTTAFSRSKTPRQLWVKLLCRLKLIFVAAQLGMLISASGKQLIKVYMHLSYHWEPLAIICFVSCNRL